MDTVDHRVQYKVRWTDFSSDDDTWEDEGNILGQLCFLSSMDHYGNVASMSLVLMNRSNINR
jgi:hypothetical protein